MDFVPLFRPPSGSETLRLPSELSQIHHQTCHRSAMSRAIQAYEAQPCLRSKVSVQLCPQNRSAVSAEARMLSLLSGLHGLTTSITQQLS